MGKARVKKSNEKVIEKNANKLNIYIYTVEAGDAAAFATMIDSPSMVDIGSQQLEARMALISIRTNILTKCTRRRESMKLPILTEAQTLGVKRPIAEGIGEYYKNPKKPQNKRNNCCCKKKKKEKRKQTITKR